MILRSKIHINYLLKTQALKIFDIKENKIELHTISNNEYLIKGNNLIKIDILFKKIEKNND